MRKNTSGFVGVSQHSEGKWVAYIGSGAGRCNLGLHPTPEAAHEARQAALALMPVKPDSMEGRRRAVLELAGSLYAAQGPGGLKASVLEAHGLDFGKLRRVGFESHAALVEALGATEAYAAWRDSERTYGGRTRPKWTWDRVVQVAGELVTENGDLPTVQWCRLNGFSQLTNAVHRCGQTWEDLRVAIGLPVTIIQGVRPRYFESRNGIRWRSRPEACLSNFLYARGVQHKRGERYPDSYADQSGRHHGHYDLHFIAPDGGQVDVEIWGDIPDAYSEGRYAVTRAKKEAFHRGRPDFLGLHYLDCQSDGRLGELLKPYIGVIPPFHFDKPHDRQIETAHWSDADELLETCRKLTAQMPDGIFPSDEWLRKRGRYADRPGETYNTISQRVNAWIGGTRQVRELLGQAAASTTRWTPKGAVEAWRRFEATHGLTPSQCRGASRTLMADPEVILEGSRIYAAAQRFDVVDLARGGRTARKTKWTTEIVIAEWHRFEGEHGLSPSQAMGTIQRCRLPEAVANDGARIYNAARRLGVVEIAKATGKI